MRRLSSTVTAPLLLCSSLLAQVQPGDLVLAYPGYPGSVIQSTAYDGTVNLSFQGITTSLPSTSSWISTSQMPDGRIVVHNNNSGSYLAFFSDVGVFLGQFSVAPANYASDIDVFADGVIGLCSRGEGILLFNDLGSPLGALNPQGMQNPMGCKVAPDDSIWVADLLTYPGSTDGKIWNVNRLGTVLHEFNTTFDASDVDLAPDGTVWVSGYNGDLAHYTVDGTLLGQFQPQIDSSLKTLWSLGVGADGVIWASGHYDSKVRGYDSTGVILYTYDTTASGNSTFCFMQDGVGWGVTSCFGDGSSSACPCGNNSAGEEGCINSTGLGGRLVAGGTNHAGSDNLELHAAQLPPGKPAAAFVGSLVLNGGSGLPFADGLRCAGGPLVMLGLRMADGQGGASWGPGMQALGGWNALDTRYFQVWYRDTSSPCGTNVNLTNLVEVTFQP